MTGRSIALAVLACTSGCAEIPATPTIQLDEALVRRDIEAAWMRGRIAADDYELLVRRAQVGMAARDALAQVQQLAARNSAELAMAEQDRIRVGTPGEAPRIPADDLRVREARADARVAAHRQVAQALGLILEEIRRRDRAGCPQAPHEALAPWDEPRR